MTKHLKSSGEHDYFIREKGERSEMENKIKKKNRKPWNGEGSVTVGRLAIESLLQMASRSVGEGSSGTDSDSASKIFFFKYYIFIKTKNFHDNCIHVTFYKLILQHVRINTIWKP